MTTAEWVSTWGNKLISQTQQCTNKSTHENSSRKFLIAKNSSFSFTWEISHSILRVAGELFNLKYDLDF